MAAAPAAPATFTDYRIQAGGKPGRRVSEARRVIYERAAALKPGQKFSIPFSKEKPPLELRMAFRSLTNSIRNALRYEGPRVRFMFDEAASSMWVYCPAEGSGPEGCEQV